MVCDRIVKLVLGDVGLEFERRLWEKEDEEEETRNKTGNEMEPPNA